MAPEKLSLLAPLDCEVCKFSVTDELIGVHCTHGVNRTGYLICRSVLCIISLLLID